MVGEVGLEPTKHYAASLQPAPIAARELSHIRQDTTTFSVTIESKIKILQKSLVD